MKYDFAYIGPSWAVQSYSSPLGHGDKIKVNIGQMFSEEFGYGLGHNKKLWLACMSVSNFWCIDEIRRCIKDYGDWEFNSDTPIIWLTCEPLGDLYYNSKKHDMSWPYYQEDEILDDGSSVEDFVETLLCQGDWLKSRAKLFDMSLKRMNDLGNPIGIIGSHCDIFPEQVEQYENLTVIEPSWQKHIAERCGITPLQNYIGADFYHQTIKIFLKDKEIIKHMNENNIDKHVHDPKKSGKLMDMIMNRKKIDWESKIDSDLINTVYDVYNHWERFEEQKLFNWVHPSIQGNKIFYNKVKYKIKEFIDDNKK